MTLISILFGRTAEDFRQQIKNELSPENLEGLVEELGINYPYEVREKLVDNMLPKDGTFSREITRAAAIYGII